MPNRPRASVVAVREGPSPPTVTRAPAAGRPLKIVTVPVSALRAWRRRGRPSTRVTDWRTGQRRRLRWCGLLNAGAGRRRQRLQLSCHANGKERKNGGGNEWRPAHDRSLKRGCFLLRIVNGVVPFPKGDCPFTLPE